MLSPRTTSDVFSLAASLELGEHSRLGVESRLTPGKSGLPCAKLNSTLGMHVGLVRDCGGSRVQTWNRYAYVGNDPLSNVDELGLVIRTPPSPQPQPPVAAPSFWDTWGNLFQGPPRRFEYQIEPPDRGGGGAVVSQQPAGPLKKAPPSDLQIRKQNGCITSAFGHAALAGVADFVGLPANIGQNLGPSFAGMSPDGRGGVEVTAGDVALLLRDPTIEMAVIGVAAKALPALSFSFATKAVPVVGWGLALYQGGKATMAGIDAYKDAFDACMARP